jgi:ubiquitin carboxyl-terminal hydrolase 2/21
MNIENEPQIGLTNIGATCYMNATLQCFSHTIKLTNYYLAPKNKNYVTSTDKKFSREYYEVIKKLWIKSYNNNKNFYSPDRFKNILSQMEPLFQGIAANDSKDLVNFILQTLHSELNIEKGPIQNNYNLNQLDEAGMFNNFLQDFQQNQNSIISSMFFGITETKTECLNCLKMRQMQGYNNHVYVHNFQIMNFIIFPLEEIRKAKYQNYYNNFLMGNSNEVSLSDCFDYYQKVELMDGENQMWCNYCNSNSASYYSTTIYSSPEILILILNRGRGNIYNVKLNFSEIINIGNYVQMKVNNNLTYHLYAIVTHIGPSSMAGHFIAFCKSPIDGKWYKFNDAIVAYVGDFNNNVSNFGTAYLLFYERQTL